MSNRNRGTYHVRPGIPIVKDTSQCFLEVKSYELNGTACKTIYVTVKINGKKYKTYYEPDFPKDPFFIDSLRPGYYVIKVSAGREYYRVKTANIYFYPNAIYTLRFYLIRKNQRK